MVASPGVASPGTARRVRRLAPGLLVVGAIVAAIAACGGGDDDDVRAFSEVQEGELRFEPDPTDPTRGIFRVRTTEPMICAIVWGEDASYGRFNNSLAMNGTGIVEHDVVLPEVEPGVEYRFVVQGTTADGTLYRSEPGTFSIDRPDAGRATLPDVPLGSNLAAGAAVVDVSSEFSNDFAAALALDDDTATEWSTQGDGDDGYVTIDLGEARAVVAVEFVTRGMADGSAVTESYTVTADGGAPAGPFPAGTIADRRVSELSTTARTLRFDVEASTGGNVGAVEIRVFGPPA
jgi:hypothetical protein